MKQNKIIIFLHKNNMEEVSWVILDESDHLIQSITHDKLSNLFSDKNHVVYVIVPGEDVLLTEVTLPKLSHQRLSQALPFALEEQLIEEVENYHFAIDKPQDNGTIPVAVVAHQNMTQWLQLLSQVNITPHALIPSMYLVPYLPSTWHINHSSDKAMVRTHQASGFICEHDTLETVLYFKTSEFEKESIHRVHTELSNQLLLENHAGTMIKHPFINLLQGQYKAKTYHKETKKLWLMACYIMISWITILLIRDIVSFFILTHQKNIIETTISQIYRSHFPQATSIVAPRERMSEKLNSLESLKNKNGFLSLVGFLSQAISSIPNSHINRLDFHDNMMILDISMATLDNLDALTKQLSQYGIDVKQEKAETKINGITATLLIRANN